MDRIEFNVTTGERKVIELTPEEVADALARTAVEAAQPVVREPIDLLRDKILELEARIAALEKR